MKADPRVLYALTAGWAAVVIAIVILLLVVAASGERVDVAVPVVTASPTPSTLQAPAALAALSPAELRALGLDTLAPVSMPPDNT